MIKVTCSIMCYNYGKYLPTAIESCINQIKGNYSLEIIVIDDGSTDNTLNICQQYGSYIKYFRSENEGFASSLTKSIKYASGEIIFLLDADDYFMPNKINTVLEEFEKDPKLLFLYHDQNFVDEDGKNLNNNPEGGNTSTQTIKKRAALDFLPAYNEQFFLTLYWAGFGKHLKKELGYYRVHSLSMSHPKDLYFWKKKLLYINIKHLKKIKSWNNNQPFWANKKLICKLYANVAANYNYIKMEIALNENKLTTAFRYYFQILYWNLRSNKIQLKNINFLITYFLLRRYIKY